MRCYNGCPDSKLKAYLDDQDNAAKKLKELYPTARCTYFPMEGMWQVFIGIDMVAESWCRDMITSIEKAIKYLDLRSKV